MPRCFTTLAALLALLVALPAPALAKKLAPGETIDLNTATLSELTRVPGIGKKKAKDILEYRDAHGPFESLDQLDNVKGIGKKSVKKLAPWLRLGRETKPEPAPVTPSTDAPKPSTPTPPPLKDEGRGAHDVEVL